MDRSWQNQITWPTLWHLRYLLSFIDFGHRFRSTVEELQTWNRWIRMALMCRSKAWSVGATMYDVECWSHVVLEELFPLCSCEVVKGYHVGISIIDYSALHQKHNQTSQSDGKCDFQKSDQENSSVFLIYRFSSFCDQVNYEVKDSVSHSFVVWGIRHACRHRGRSSPREWDVDLHSRLQQHMLTSFQQQNANMLTCGSCR